MLRPNCQHSCQSNTAIGYNNRGWEGAEICSWKPRFAWMNLPEELCMPQEDRKSVWNSWVDRRPVNIEAKLLAYMTEER